MVPKISTRLISETAVTVYARTASETHDALLPLRMGRQCQWDVAALDAASLYKGPYGELQKVSIMATALSDRADWKYF